LAPAILSNALPARVILAATEGRILVVALVLALFAPRAEH
jgi:hypothetical protein